MYDDITNIKSLRNTHPFLHKTFDLFSNFNEAVEKKAINAYYEMLCKVITDKLGKSEEIYIEFCKKLVKNYKIFCRTSQKCKTTSDYCYDLNNWIYITMKTEKIEKWLVKKIYEGIQSFANQILHRSICPYYSYDKDYREPNKIVFLYIFTSNITKMKEILKADNHLLKCYCKEFVKNMVKIYKRMNEAYCTKGKDKIKENEKTCSVLKSFSTFYTVYLCDEEPVKNILPLLTSEEDIESIECERIGDISASQETNELSQLKPAEDSDLFQDVSDETIRTIQDFEPFTLKVSITKILSTFLATVAGISSLLLLSWKFTPIRSILLSRKKVETIKNMYDRSDDEELLYSTFDNTNINLYNRRYDIAYGNI